MTITILQAVLLGLFILRDSKMLCSLYGRSFHVQYRHL